MKNLLVLILSLFMASGVCAQSLEDAKIELFNCNDTVARDMFLQLLKTDTANKVEIEYHLGVLHSYLVENSTATLYFESVANAAPGNPLASIALGRIALINKDTVAARVKFAEAMNLPNKNKSMVFLEVGSAYDEFTHFYSEAVTILQTALSLDTGNALNMLMLASACSQLANETNNTFLMAESIELLAKARSINSKLTITYLRSGGDLIKFAEKDMQEMRHDSNRVLIKVLQALNNQQLDDNDLNALIAMPDSTLKNLFLDSAIIYLTQATTASNNKVSNSWLLLGNATYKRFRKPTVEVIKAYETANILRNHRFYDACFNLGVVYNEANRIESALENMLMAYELKPEEPNVVYLLAQIYAKLDRDDKVKYWLKKALVLKAPQPADYYNIGTCFGKVGHNLPKAIYYIKKAISMNPNIELYYEDLAVAYGINRQYDKSISVSQKLIKLNPRYAPAYNNLAISYRNKGDKNREKYYEDIYKEIIVSTGK